MLISQHNCVLAQYCTAGGGHSQDPNARHIQSHNSDLDINFAPELRLLAQLNLNK